MKIRIKGNSIRFRLTKSEVDGFRNEGTWKEHTRIGDSTFTYELIKSNNHPSPHALFSNNKISIYIPEEISRQWTQSDQVGFSHLQNNPDGSILFLLVEKDFVCLDNTDEDQSDNYPNPNAAC